MVDTTLDPRENGFKPALLLTVMSYLTPAIFKHVSGSPPHARGADPRSAESGQEVGITPACAGSRSIPSASSSRGRDHPRMRGEQQFKLGHLGTGLGSPPHARGADTSEIAELERRGITPACAGSSLIVNLVSSRDKDHPRMRGEQPWR